MQTVLEKIEQEASEALDNHKTHLINPPNNLHIWREGMDIQTVLQIARREQLPLKLLCGLVFVPERDPDKYPACDECIRVAGELMRGAGE